MKNYILSVTDSGINIPLDIPKGQYKLVELTNTECKSYNLHKWQDIESYIKVTDTANSATLSRVKTALRWSEYKYVEDFKDASANDIIAIRNVGLLATAFIIAICQLFSVSIAHVDSSYASLIEHFSNQISLKTE